MIKQIAIGAIAGLVAVGGAGPAAAQLRFSVTSPEQCEATAQRIVDKVYYYKKLKIEQQHYNRIRRQVGPGAAQAINDLNGWARREPASLARQCRYAFPTPSRPWTYEYRD